MSSSTSDSDPEHPPITVDLLATSFLRKGTIIESANTKRRFEIGDIISKGPVRVVVRVLERNAPLYQRIRSFALKAECINVDEGDFGLRGELNLLSKVAEARRMRPAMTDSFVELLDRGITENFRFIVITALGQTVAELQKFFGGFPMSTAVRINKRTFNAIRQLHTLGFIHRNIQPSNFCMGAQDKMMFIIGFSLVRRMEQDDRGNEVFPSNRATPQPSTSTVKEKFSSRRLYVSVDRITRWDDIESWLFMSIEMCSENVLPWASSSMPSEVLEIKRDFFLHQYTFDLFQDRLPSEYAKVIDIINAAVPTSTPDYDKISLMNDKLTKQFPSRRKAASPADANTISMTRSLMLPTVAAPVTNSLRENNLQTIYGMPPSHDVFKPKDKNKYPKFTSKNAAQANGIKKADAKPAPTPPSKAVPISPKCPSPSPIENPAKSGGTSSGTLPTLSGPKPKSAEIVKKPETQTPVTPSPKSK